MAKREKKGKSKSSAGYIQKIGEDFLLQNGQKEGVAETATGLQYTNSGRSGGRKTGSG